MHRYTGSMSVRKALLGEALLLLLWAASFHTAVVLPRAQSFVLVPSQPHPHKNYPHSSVHLRKKYSSTTALLVRNRDDRKSKSTYQRHRTNPNPAISTNKKLVELGKKKQWRQLLELAEKEQASFNNVNYATVMSQLGRIRSLNKEDPGFLALLQSLAAFIEERGLPWIQARSAANIIHAIGKMDLRNPSTKRILEWIAQPKVAAHFVEEAEPQEAANVAWACATLGFEAPKLLAEIEHRSTWLVEKGTPQAVAITAWACATLGFEAPKLFAEIDRRSKWLVQEGDPQAVANTALACAKLGFKAPRLFAEIENRSKWLVKEGVSQAVANTAWACATLGFEAPNLFVEIEGQSKWLVEEGKPQEVANTAWACATLGFQALNLFAEIEHRSKWLVKEGVSQAVANTAWACAKLGVEAPKLFAEIEGQSEWLVEEGGPQTVATTAWACATLGLEAPNLFAEIESRSKWLVKKGNPQDVANTVWAFATLEFEASALFFELDHHADRLIEHGNPQDISNTCYAIAVSGKSKDSEALLAKLWDRAIELFVTGEEFIDEALWQLAQTQIFAETDGITLRTANS